MDKIIVQIYFNCLLCLFLICRMNGGHCLSINFDTYVTEYVNRHHERCDAIHKHGGRRHKASLDVHEDEEDTTSAPTFSSIYAA